MFAMGFVVGGAGTSGTKPLVIRAVGPSLVPLGVSGALEDPKLEIFAGTSKTGENDNWGGATALTNAMSGVGAFAFANTASRDAAMMANAARGNNSVSVSATGNGTGAVLAEIYEVTPATTTDTRPFLPNGTANPNFGMTTGGHATTTPRLINVSVLKHLGSGLTVGFVVGGSSSRTVLIRAVGPTLGMSPFNVSGAVANPQLELYSGSTRIGGNNDWGGTAPRGTGPDGLAGTPDDVPNALDISLSAAFAQVGAFALPLGSRDAALVTTLVPGNYSVQVSGVGGTTGMAIVEIYEMP
jgi:hypothetical protein